MSEVEKNNIVHISSVSEVPEGYFQAGKIVYNPKDVLGHGCEGTFVYR